MEVLRKNCNDYNNTLYKTIYHQAYDFMEIEINMAPKSWKPNILHVIISGKASIYQLYNVIISCLCIIALMHHGAFMHPIILIYNNDYL